MPQFQILPVNTVKFRENSSDSVVFHLEGSTAEMPYTMTFTRQLPTARKGNNGTMKTFVNIRFTVNIGTDEVPKYVPQVVKLETSIPVGSEVTTFVNKLLYPIRLLSSNNADTIDELERVFVHGLLPVLTDANNV